MKTMHTCATVILRCLAAAVLTGCVATDTPTYPGAPRPATELAKVEIPAFVDCSRVDGKRTSYPLRIDFLPGVHSMRAKVFRKSKKMRYKRDPVTFSFHVEAGQKYRMKVCFHYVDSKGDIYDPHYYYVHKQGGAKSDALHALGIKDWDGWVYLDWLPTRLDVDLIWTPYLLNVVDGSVASPPDPEVGKALRQLLATVKSQQEELWKSGK